MKILILFFFAVCLPLSSFAGSRGLDIAFVDVTTGTKSKEGARLAELFVKDMRSLFASEKHAELFPWSDSDIDLTVLKPDGLGAQFDRLLNSSNTKKVRPVLEKNDAQDGLVVFFYDRKHGYARLKLYDSEGNECLLLRLPLEGKHSAMKYSLLRQVRHGAVAAIGSSVRWSP